MSVVALSSESVTGLHIVSRVNKGLKSESKGVENRMWDVWHTQRKLLYLAFYLRQALMPLFAQLGCKCRFTHSCRVWVILDCRYFLFTGTNKDTYSVCLCERQRVYFANRAHFVGNRGTVLLSACSVEDKIPETAAGL